MSTHRHFDRICCVVLAITLLIALLFVNGEALGLQAASSAMGYESRLFDTSAVHTIDIVMDDWEGFLENCTDEEYVACSVVIDGEAYQNVAIRAKGNTSLTQVASYGNDRYSFKIEFDHYDSGKTYYGLDKLCLNNIIQDNTYMKDYLVYQMMAGMGVAAPLCSYVNISVNGESWGLYLAVEGVEESFLQRNYGGDYGELYKPDSTSMGGGRGNGQGFDMEDWTGFGAEAGGGEPEGLSRSEDAAADGTDPGRGGPDQFGEEQQNENLPDGVEESGRTWSELPDMGGAAGEGQFGGGEQSGMTIGSDDVLLKYIDDDADSYANIFDNAKTDVSDSDEERLIAALKQLSEGEDIAEAVDVESVIRYFVVHNFVLNFDSYTGSMIHNYYLYEEDGQLSMIPWDYNLAFGGFDSSAGATGLVNYPIDDPVSGGSVEDRPMLAWIFGSEEYTELYHQYFAELISLYFDSGSFSAMIDETEALISACVEEDPTKFCTYEEFQTGVATLKEFCLLRAESVAGQLDGTIGSTSDTQSEDTLIDAGELNISDMGVMNNGMGGGTQALPGAEAGGEMPALSQGGEAEPSEPGGTGETDADLPEPGGGTELAEPGADMPGAADQMGAAPEQSGSAQAGAAPEQNESAQAGEWLWLGISAGVLALGLLAALLFRRRG